LQAALIADAVAVGRAVGLEVDDPKARVAGQAGAA
jgi:hypothetical protein